jgi:hypothetical protein
MEIFTLDNIAKQILQKFVFDHMQVLKHKKRPKTFLLIGTSYINLCI